MNRSEGQEFFSPPPPSTTDRSTIGQHSERLDKLFGSELETENLIRTRRQASLEINLRDAGRVIRPGDARHWPASLAPSEFEPSASTIFRVNSRGSPRTGTTRRFEQTSLVDLTRYRRRRLIARKCNVTRIARRPRRRQRETKLAASRNERG